MKQGIHPNWNHNCVVTCGCGNTFVTGGSTDSMQIDICSACHPFFTGEMRFVDRQGRVDKFMQKMKAAQSKQTDLKNKKSKKTSQGPQKSYQEILREQRAQVRGGSTKTIQAKTTSSSNKTTSATTASNS
ncbi:MAG: 50S ribosomal protein L31 [Patescibacteria group bacterium]